MTTPATPEQPQELTRFVFSYAYDVPHYADFTIEATTEEEAERLAKKLLKTGTLPEIFDDEAEANYENSTEERVFIHEGATDHDWLETIEEAAARKGKELPENWRELPPAQPAEPEPETEEDAFKLKQEKTLFSKLAAMTREDLETIILDFALTAHGSYLEEDYEASGADVFEGICSILHGHGLRPEGNLYDSYDQEAAQN